MMRHITENTFAAACFDQNNGDELRAALAGPPDSADMKAWDLTPQSWRAAIETALAAKLES